MVRTFAIMLPVISCFTFCGCQQSSSPAEDPGIAELASQLSTLQTKVAKMEGDQRFLLTRLVKVEKQIRASAPKTEVEFDPSSTSYRRVDGDLGIFAVAISDVRPFADGVRVTLKLGNPSSMTYSGATLTLEYGPRAPSSDPTGPPDAAVAWLGALQQRTEKITTTLAPGRWNPVQITLPKIEAKDFGYLSVSIETDEIILR